MWDCFYTNLNAPFLLCHCKSTTIWYFKNMERRIHYQSLKIKLTAETAQRTCNLTTSACGRWSLVTNQGEAARCSSWAFKLLALCLSNNNNNSTSAMVYEGRPWPTQKRHWHSQPNSSGLETSFQLRSNLGLAHTPFNAWHYGYDMPPRLVMCAWAFDKRKQLFKCVTLSKIAVF